jgi:GPH family glycoside/pentoside/hexuronide:cation symporter
MKEKPLTTKEKVIAGGGNASIYLLMSLSMTPITYYYNIILGLDAGLIAIVWLIFAIWNAINDPLFGVFQERFVSKKYGRRIPYLRFGAPFLTLTFILLWMPFLITDVNSEIALFFHFLVILLAFDTVYTFIASANFALQYEIAFTKKERTNLSIYVNLFNAIATGITMAAPLIFLYNRGGEANPTLYPSLIILGIIGMIVIITTSFVLKEKPYLRYEEPLGLKEGILLCFSINFFYGNN